MTTTSTINLLDYFALRHTQLTQLHAEVRDFIAPQQRVQAKVELNLSPREIKTAASENRMPSYQIATTLTCEGRLDEADQKEKSKPVFTARVSFLATYQQIQGEALAFDDFKHQHPPLTRQLYPIAHGHLRTLMQQVGLDKVQLPFDLINQEASSPQPVSLH